MSLHSLLRSQRLSILALATALSLAACATAPQEVTPNQTTNAPQEAASNQPTSASPAVTASPASATIAVGHGSAAPSSAPERAADAASGVKWTPPTRWRTGPNKPMRAATYLIPAANGDSEGAECAVFMNIGGGVDANLKRWIGQFEQPDGSPSGAKAQEKKETINGFSVRTIDLTGTFTGGGVAMGGPATKKKGYRLLGAIVETPEGEVFFKMTGPAKTVQAARGEFQNLLKSLEQ